jgi:hypothetical protein
MTRCCSEIAVGVRGCGPSGAVGVRDERRNNTVIIMVDVSPTPVRENRRSVTDLTWKALYVDVVTGVR